MKTDVKLSIGLFIAIFVLIVFVSVVSIAWASANQQLDSLIKVTYRVGDVSVNVSANKYFQTDSPEAFTGGDNGVARFDGSLSTQTLQTTQTELRNYAPYVVFEYVFENTSTNEIHVSLNASDLNNLTMFVTSPLTTQKQNVFTNFNELDYTQASTISGEVIQSGGTAYIYIAIKITRLANNAYCPHEFVWTIQ